MFRLARKTITIILIFILGAAAGGFIVTKIRPRSFLSISQCKETTCLRSNEFLGLLGSIGMQYAPNLLPGIILETEYNVVIEHPRPATKVHYVVIPKKDIKNIADVQEGDDVYVQDAVEVIGELVRRDNLNNYRVITNGPGYQSVAYLHFHLMSK